MDVLKLLENLKKVQESKGYLFNNDNERTLALLEGLIFTREQHGYMSCPCRPATGDIRKDKDIICPCQYRAYDIQEYGSCYCYLYVSRDWNEGKIKRIYVPDRRLPDKFF